MATINERTSVSIVFVGTIVTFACAFAWGYAKLDSRVEQAEKATAAIHRMDRRLYRMELKMGVKEVEPINE